MDAPFKEPLTNLSAEDEKVLMNKPLPTGRQANVKVQMPKPEFDSLFKV